MAYNMDCMEAMRQMPDKCFDLAVCDPPYGINRFKSGETSRLRKYGSLDSVNNLRPTKEWFLELERVSKNQIVFGYNHLSDILPTTSEFIFWYKHQPVDTYADGELAWTSFHRTAKCFDYPFFGMCGSDNDGRIHPTQSPSPSMPGYSSTTQNRVIKSWTPTLAAAPAGLRPTMQGLTLLALKSARNTLTSRKNALRLIRRRCAWREYERLRTH